MKAIKNLMYYTFVLAFVSFLSSCFGESGTDSDSDDGYRAAIKNNDFEKAHDILGRLYDEYTEELDRQSRSLQYDSGKNAVIAKATKYTNAASEVYCAEARAIMANGGDNAQERIVYLLSEVPIIGQKIPEGTKIDTYDSKKAYIACYRLYVQCNNKICDAIFDISMNSGNKRLAAIALNKYLQIPSGDGEFSGTVSYDNSADSIAREKFNNAVADGAFGDE